MAIQIQIRRDAAANWTSANPILAQGEIGYEIDTKKIKIGDGSTAWNSLEYYMGEELGDMKKTIYDTDNNGIVDKAEAIDDGKGNSAIASDITSAVDLKHTHLNKTLLDAYDQTNADIKDAVSLKHDPSIWGTKEIDETNIADAKMIQYSASEGKWIIVDSPSGGGASDFLGLSDTPSTYSGQAGLIPKVKSDESGLEFVSGAGGDTLPVVDTTSIVKNSTDTTKKVRIDASNIATGTTRVLTMPDKDITPVGKDEQGYISSPMVISGGLISEGTNTGTFKVSALTAFLRTSNSLTSELVKVVKDGEDNISIPLSDTTYFVCLNYNGGNPSISLSTSDPYSADKRSIPIAKVMKNDKVHYINGGFRFNDGLRRLHQRAKTLRELELKNGSVITYSGTNNFTMDAGAAYGGINEYLLDSYNSSVTPFTYIYGNGSGGWAEVASNTIDYAHFDNGDGTLGSIQNNKYGVHYIYRHIDDGSVFVVYGKGSYTLAEAELAATSIPETPSQLNDFGCLIGSVIVPKVGGSFAKVIMATSQFFYGAEIANHNNLGGLQGGTADEYYHLTNTEHTIATQPANGSSDGYLTSTDWNNFNNKLSGIENKSIGDLSDVDLTNVDNEKILQYNTTSNKFECVDAPSSSSGSIFDYVSYSDPTATVNPDHDYATWLNKNSGILFICTNRNTNYNTWVSKTKKIDIGDLEEKTPIYSNDEIVIRDSTGGGENKKAKASTIFDYIKTVDGDGSELDADTVDGKHATDFVTVDGSLANYYKTYLNSGWYTIAVNNSDYATGKFAVKNTYSGKYQSVIFEASVFKNNNAGITVLHNSSQYEVNSTIKGIRVKTGQYSSDGALLQIYQDNSSNYSTVYFMGDNFQSSGWVLKNWVNDATDPGDVSYFPRITNVKAAVDLTNIINNGVLTTGNIYAGDNTDQYKVWHNGDATISKATNGYQKLPSGLIMQWGTASQGTVTFPIAFPTACVNVNVTSMSGTNNAYVSVNGITTTQFTLYNSGGYSNNWIAIGY